MMLPAQKLLKVKLTCPQSAPSIMSSGDSSDSSHFQIATLTVAACHAIRLSLHPSPHPTEPTPATAVPACNAPARHTDLQTCRVRQVGRGSRSRPWLFSFLRPAALCSFVLSIFSFHLSTVLFLLLLLLPAPASLFTSAPLQPPLSSSAQSASLSFHPLPATPRTRYRGSGGVGFSLAEVHQELQMLQRQLGDSESAWVRLCVHGFLCGSVLKTV